MDKLQALEDLLPGIQEYLCHQLSGEKLSRPAANQRLEFIKLLDKYKTDTKRVPSIEAGEDEMYEDTLVPDKPTSSFLHRNGNGSSLVEDVNGDEYYEDTLPTSSNGSARPDSFIERQKIPLPPIPGQGGEQDEEEYECPVAAPAQDGPPLPPRFPPTPAPTVALPPRPVAPLPTPQIEQEDYEDMYEEPVSHQATEATSSEITLSTGDDDDEMYEEVPITPQTEQAPEAVSEDTYDIPDVDQSAMGRNSIVSPPGGDSGDESGSYEDYDDDEEDTKKKGKVKKKESKPEVFELPEAQISGVLQTKRKIGGWVKRFCAVKDSRFLAYKRATDDKPYVDMYLPGSSVVYSEKEGKKQHVVKLVGGGDTHVLSVGNKAEADKWIKLLEEETLSGSGGMLAPGGAKVGRTPSNVSDISRGSNSSRENEDVQDGNDSGKGGTLERHEDKRKSLGKDKKKKKKIKAGDFIVNTFGKSKGKKLSAQLSDSDIVITGYLNISTTLLGDTKWTRRWCMIKNHYLEVHKNAKDDIAELTFPLKGCSLKPFTDETKKSKKDMAIQLNKHDVEIILEAETSEDLGMWLRLLVEETGSTNPDELSSLSCVYVDIEPDSKPDRPPMLKKVSQDSIISSGEAYMDLSYPDWNDQPAKIADKSPKPSPKQSRKNEKAATIEREKVDDGKKTDSLESEDGKPKKEWKLTLGKPKKEKTSDKTEKEEKEKKGGFMDRFKRKKNKSSEEKVEDKTEEKDGAKKAKEDTEKKEEVKTTEKSVEKKVSTTAKSTAEKEAEKKPSATVTAGPRYGKERAQAEVTRLENRKAELQEEKDKQRNKRVELRAKKQALKDKFITDQKLEDEIKGVSETLVDLEKELKETEAKLSKALKDSNPSPVFGRKDSPKLVKTTNSPATTYKSSATVSIGKTDAKKQTTSSSASVGKKISTGEPVNSSPKAGKKAVMERAKQWEAMGGN
ncbi:AFAP1 [Branchiostoma lanceolatum]|uniref:AFAP1 protein n=1 Tax=Branchiostoma lanceolatum TaxID=7740 RepID=A0A8J9YPE5_BRALA|nr:AFAP1 [Branchiostoma lanceolatum]